MRSCKTILLLSADERLNRTAALILKGAGFQVITVANHTEAIVCLETTDIDLVLFDVKEESVECLLEVHQKCPEIPLLILGRVQQSEEPGQRQSPYTCLEKPVDPEIIIDQIQQILEKSTVRLSPCC